MISARWKKVWRDLWLYKTRTLVVVLSIAVGVFAIGVIGGTRSIFSREMATSYVKTRPAHALLLTLTPFDDKTVERVRNVAGVADAEARGGAYVRLQTGPDEWQLTQLVAITDFNDQRMDRVSPESGDWPPLERELLVERSAAGLVGAGVGDTVNVKLPNGREKQMRIGGLAADTYARLFVLDGVAYAYVTLDTMEWLGLPREYNDLRVLVDEDLAGRGQIERIANDVQDQLEDSGSPVLFTFVPNPGEHPLNFVVQAIMIMLGALGIMALGLSGFLVINTVSALMTQQTRQIGMMKALGAQRSHLVAMYIVMVAMFGGLALLVALPLGALGAFAFTNVLADFFNIDITSFRFPTNILLLEAAVAILVPVLAGMIPVLSGTRVTVHEAISDYGLGESAYGQSRLDRWLAQAQGLTRAFSRPSLLSLRNTFRRKGRLILTLITMTLAGVVFIVTFSLYNSFLGTIDNMLSYYNYDVAFQFSRPYRVAKLMDASLDVPGVTAAEGWGFYNTRIVKRDGSHTGNVIIFAPPADTSLANPVISEGRWLVNEDGRAIVVNSMMLRDLPGVDVGDEITLKIEGRETDWQIVGIATGGNVAPMGFVNYPAYARTVGQVGRADWLMIATEEHTEEFQLGVMRELERRYEKQGFNVGVTTVISQEKREVQAIFQGILSLLLMMTFLLAAVGGLGLMGTMSINVLERTREVGVMRAIGAANRSVLQIFVQEGIIIGALSWLLSVLVAWPLSRLISESVGRAFLNEPLAGGFSWSGVLTWLLFVIIISAIASYWPARSAARLTVREVLAYE